MNGGGFLILRDNKCESLCSFGCIEFSQVERTVDFSAFQERVIWKKKQFNWKSIVINIKNNHICEL